jgi:hypothetical protein
MLSLLASMTSVAFALLAAGFWAWSSLVYLPVVGSTYATITNIEPFYAATKKVARLNTAAAGCAFVSALTQAVALHTPC